MTAYGGFVWPKKGVVKPRKWSKRAECGDGLHGWLWGVGDASLGYGGYDGAVWLVAEVDAEKVVDLAGKVKVPEAKVVYAGWRDAAVEYILKRGGLGKPVMYAKVIAGHKETAVVGAHGVATAGVEGTAVAGEDGVANAGPNGTAISGVRGRSSAGDFGVARSSASGVSEAGLGGTAEAGQYGRAYAGDYGRAVSGLKGVSVTGEHGTAESGEGGVSCAGANGVARVSRGGRAKAGPGGTLSFERVGGGVVAVPVDGRRAKPGVYYVYDLNRYRRCDDQSEPARV